MFLFFTRKSNFKSRSTISKPTAIAIDATMRAIELQMQRTGDWTRKARQALDQNDFDKSAGFLFIAKGCAEEVRTLMESVSILHDLSLDEA